MMATVDALVYVNSAHENLRYVKEAAASAASFRRYYPDAQYILFTDAVGYSDAVFDQIRPAKFTVPEQLGGAVHKNGQMVVKLAVLPTVQADRIMYLGSDTFALKPEAGSLFTLLDRFDMAAAHAPVRINTSLGNSPLPGVPPCFPEFNCDVLLWRRHERTIELLRDWERLYLSHDLGHPHDQGPFRLLVYESDLRVATLPPEFNYRGPGVRADTVILQNRDLLAAYLSPSTDRPPLALRAANRGLRKLRIEVRQCG